MILDSCHSGHGSRDDQDDRVIARSIDLGKDYKVLSSLEDSRSRSRYGKILEDFETSGLRSHVLLAGAGATQLSMEDAGRGRFTKNLINYVESVIQSDGTFDITYETLIDQMKKLVK